MTKKILCQKLNKELDALPRQPYPGELGKRIHESISKDAWGEWLKHQTMLINEYHLILRDPKAREFLEGEMENFFFGDGTP